MDGGSGVANSAFRALGFWFGILVLAFRCAVSGGNVEFDEVQ